jgi:putative hydrolase
MLYDFHTHTFLSDGSLSALELIRRACVSGYAAIGLTDHVGPGSLERVLGEIEKDCAMARAHWNIVAVPGVELTHLPPEAIPEMAKKAKLLGASIVVVHGETLSEPVIRGTNLAAVQCRYVDVLAHPGTLSPEEAASASKNGVFIEITTRKSHRQPNAEVAKAAIQAGALILINSDAHDPEDLLNIDLATATAHSAGIPVNMISDALERNPTLLLERLRSTIK